MPTMEIRKFKAEDKDGNIFIIIKRTTFLGGLRTIIEYSTQTDDKVQTEDGTTFVIMNPKVITTGMPVTEILVTKI